MNAGQMRTIIMERIAGDFMNQVVRMDVDNVETCNTELWKSPDVHGNQ